MTKPWRKRAVDRMTMLQNKYIWIILMLFLSLCLFRSCAYAGLNTPQDVERWIESRMPSMTNEVYNCQEQALIPTRWMTNHGYKYEICVERFDGGKSHAYGKWSKGDSSGVMFKASSNEPIWCYTPSAYQLYRTAKWDFLREEVRKAKTAAEL